MHKEFVDRDFLEFIFRALGFRELVIFNSGSIFRLEIVDIKPLQDTINMSLSETIAMYHKITLYQFLCRGQMMSHQGLSFQRFLIKLVCLME